MRETRGPLSMGILTLALTLFGLVFFVATILIIHGAPYLAGSLDSADDRQWTNWYWLAMLIVIPTVITGAVSGLTSAFGAYIGKRVSTTTDGMAADRMKISVGAGVGGALGSALFLIYMSWRYQSGPGLWILVLGFTVVFCAYAGFTALWIGRRSWPSQTPAAVITAADGM
ncbi:hypothetical protein [Microbacterium phyllosphaerae]|uniref:hypothetical protein n=1 Tax=Microbacterium phyllosphaerae TaxID=124798 RepID=UPI002167D853|nr:hypothetical protein [Microbacterium phyllosphaerae]MCS3442821.1 hypothetical protein [Microbacterium phyllosphaerae]